VPRVFGYFGIVKLGLLRHFDKLSASQAQHKSQKDAQPNLRGLIQDWDMPDYSW